ncbi:hypothetical protein NQ318_020396 [Aromia moschata]|uniref:PiggyBac transposable element-derived protein domain-containing protein n=1 Tax=Aromia moschata TaxID=1265417 RepID=A0AAV8Y2D6_9CUCU|nr:hypothetical protein NQ318_020396 [Aromia moschata]
MEWAVNVNSDQENPNFVPQAVASDRVVWSVPNNNFTPRISVTDDRPTALLAKLNRSATRIDLLQVFPRSLLMLSANVQISDSRFYVKNGSKAKTDPHEIMLLVVTVLVINNLPNLSDYWSQHPSMGNDIVKMGVSRNRFQLLINTDFT